MSEEGLLKRPARETDTIGATDEQPVAQTKTEVTAEAKIPYTPIRRMKDGSLAAYDEELGGVIKFGTENQAMIMRELLYAQEHRGDYEKNFGKFEERNAQTTSVIAPSTRERTAEIETIATKEYSSTQLMNSERVAESPLEKKVEENADVENVSNFKVAREVLGKVGNALALVYALPTYARIKHEKKETTFLDEVMPQENIIGPSIACGVVASIGTSILTISALGIARWGFGVTIHPEITDLVFLPYATSMISGAYEFFRHTRNKMKERERKSVLETKADEKEGRERYIPAQIAPHTYRDIRIGLLSQLVADKEYNSENEAMLAGASVFLSRLKHEDYKVEMSPDYPKGYYKIPIEEAAKIVCELGLEPSRETALRFLDEISGYLIEDEERKYASFRKIKTTKGNVVYILH